ncbi:MAG: hypothetical protein K2P81_13005 [Bacteriovoracaceae bacterium]|nr:hypothetical protein [Bacteriovoracaceae bacterium]
MKTITLFTLLLISTLTFAQAPIKGLWVTDNVMSRENAGSYTSEKWNIGHNQMFREVTLNDSYGAYFTTKLKYIVLAESESLLHVKLVEIRQINLKNLKSQVIHKTLSLNLFNSQILNR